MCRGPVLCKRHLSSSVQLFFRIRSLAISSGSKSRPRKAVSPQSCDLYGRHFPAVAHRYWGSLGAGHTPWILGIHRRRVWVASRSRELAVCLHVWANKPNARQNQSRSPAGVLLFVFDELASIGLELRLCASLVIRQQLSPLGRPAALRMVSEPTPRRSTDLCRASVATMTRHVTGGSECHQATKNHEQGSNA